MFSAMDDDTRLKHAEPAAGTLRVVLDTDTYNEIDDQFAVLYALMSAPKLDIEALYAAPFLNERSAGPGDGMEKSYGELLHLLELAGAADKRALRGAQTFMTGPDTPCESPAAADLVERANSPGGSPLYVAAMGAITNVASAILLDPDIAGRLVVVWIGGQPLHWPDTDVFNVRQDVHAARVVLNSGVPLVHIPCHGVASHLLLSVPELEQCAEGCGRMGNYLLEITRGYQRDTFAWAKEIWDMSAVAYLIDPSWVPVDRVACPLLNDDLTWSHDPSRHHILNARFVHRNPVFKDFFTKMRRVRT